ncbi:MAG: FHA domain-containing protein, partial [Cyanophyceae cyanobacterium]
MTELQLRVQMPGTADRIVTVNKDDFRIGRSSECDFVVSSYGISRQHLRLSYSHEKQGWMAQDLGSKNGTRLNQSPLIGEQGINHGDRIVVETVCFVVLLKAGSAMEITPANIRAGNSTSSTRSSPPTQTNIITRLPDGIRVDGWQPLKAAGAPMVEKSPHVQY